MSQRCVWAVCGVFTFQGQIKSHRDLSLLLTHVFSCAGKLLLFKSTYVNRNIVNGNFFFFFCDNNLFTLTKNYLQLDAKKVSLFSCLWQHAWQFVQPDLICICTWCLHVHVYIFYLWIIDHLGAEVTVTSLAAVHALWWQKNSNNQWNKICKIHGIREKISLLVLLDVRIRMQKKDGLYFLEYCWRRALKRNTFMIVSH